MPLELLLLLQHADLSDEYKTDLFEVIRITIISL